MKNKELLILVIDGQGGGIGKQIVERLSKIYSSDPDVTVRALGTNALATNAMLRAGADDGATGENAIIFNSGKADIITGVLPISMPNSILGEVTPRMAEAIGSSDALKVLIPLQKCNTIVTMVSEGTLSQFLDEAEKIILEQINKQRAAL